MARRPATSMSGRIRHHLGRLHVAASKVATTLDNDFNLVSTVWTEDLDSVIEAMKYFPTQGIVSADADPDKGTVTVTIEGDER